jgi:hypothetical protein
LTLFISVTLCMSLKRNAAGELVDERGEVF